MTTAMPFDSPLELALTSAVALSIALYLTMLVAFALAFRRRAPRELARCPRVTILKPIAGLDEELRENLESFAALDYPAYELLLGFADHDDPAIPTARAFIAAHPGLDARLVMTDPQAALNPKVAQLIGLERRATGEVIVVSDANVRVSPDYLQGLVCELLQPGVGLVSSLVAGTGEETFGAALENLHLGAQIGPGVIASAFMFGRPLTIGKSMAVWRRDLVQLGGFASVSDVLAEDYVLGRRFREHGYGVRVVLDPVENRNVRCSMLRTVERHTRWAKMRRAIVPGAFLLEPLLSPTAIALVAWMVLPSARAAMTLGFSAALQIVGAAWTTTRIRGRGLGSRVLLLEPLRALAVQVCWVRAALSRRVDWRGHPFVVGPDSALTPARAFVAPRTERV